MPKPEPTNQVSIPVRVQEKGHCYGELRATGTMEVGPRVRLRARAAETVEVLSGGLGLGLGLGPGLGLGLRQGGQGWGYGWHRLCARVSCNRTTPHPSPTSPATSYNLSPVVPVRIAPLPIAPLPIVPLPIVPVPIAPLPIVSSFSPWQMTTSPPCQPATSPPRRMTTHSNACPYSARM